MPGGIESMLTENCKYITAGEVMVWFGNRWGPRGEVCLGFHFESLI